MTITMIYAPIRDQVSLMRVLDGQRRRLCLLCRFGQTPAEVYTAIADQLTAEEQHEVSLAFGLDPP